MERGGAVRYHCVCADNCTGSTAWAAQQRLGALGASQGAGRSLGAWRSLGQQHRQTTAPHAPWPLLRRRRCIVAFAATKMGPRVKLACTGKIGRRPMQPLVRPHARSFGDRWQPATRLMGFAPSKASASRYTYVRDVCVCLVPVVCGLGKDMMRMMRRYVMNEQRRQELRGACRLRLPVAPATATCVHQVQHVGMYLCYMYVSGSLLPFCPFPACLSRLSPGPRLGRPRVSGPFGRQRLWIRGCVVGTVACLLQGIY